jgi:hypothetical protein
MPGEDFANDLLQRASDATRRTELAIEAIRTDVRWIREQGERHENAIFGASGDNGLRSRVRVLEQRYPAAVNMVEAAIRQTMPSEEAREKTKAAKWRTKGEIATVVGVVLSLILSALNLLGVLP